jgi:hypothetical protein
LEQRRELHVTADAWHAFQVGQIVGVLVADVDAVFAELMHIPLQLIGHVDSSTFHQHPSPHGWKWEAASVHGLPP